MMYEPGGRTGKEKPRGTYFDVVGVLLPKGERVRISCTMPTVVMGLVYNNQYELLLMMEQERSLTPTVEREFILLEDPARIFVPENEDWYYIGNMMQNDRTSLQRKMMVFEIVKK